MSLKELAKNLRKNPTDAERKLWQSIRNRQIRGYKFRRQVVIEPYIVDFVSFEKKLIIELDGSQHILQKQKDEIRDEYLKNKGYRVLRFWDNDVFLNTEIVLQHIYNFLDENKN